MWLTVLLITILIGLLIIIWRRDRQIKKLADLVRQMTDNEPVIDLCDHKEGSLSILRSDIYKLAKQLAGQTSLRREEKVKLKEILFDVSHQLKTPLTSMTVMTDLLEQENLPPAKRKEFVHNLQISLNRMDWLVKSLLKLATLDADAELLQIRKISAQELVSQVVAQLDTIISVKEQKITLAVDSELEMMADVNWTAEALLNILKNAAEHTQNKGEIIISAGENSVFKWLSVADNGPGIARRDIARVFQRFYRGQNAAKDSVGIGLAMSLAIMQKQNGDIEVKSSPGKGTVFILKFYK